MATKYNKQSGFTLIELSIVLVIIGLIVGGVLVGQDLIKAAKIRATVSQIEKFNAASNTFRGKYNGYPGDLANPENFFATALNSDGTRGLADGNRLIEGAGAAAGVLTGETAMFWSMLALAGLIGDPVSTATYTTDPAGNIDATFPQAKLGNGNRILVVAQSGVNYFAITKPTSAVLSVAVTDLGMSPIDAFQIDTKLDNGAPGSGVVLSIDATTAGTTPTPGTYSTTPACEASATAYNTTTAALSNAIACSLGIKASF